MFKKYLITGPESSGTRMVSKFVANALGVINSVDKWDGHWEVSSGGVTVYHRSLPHGERDNFPGPEDFDSPEQIYTIICTRDPEICYRSAKPRHNKNNPKVARDCLNKAQKKIKEIMKSGYPFSFFSYESALLLGKDYLDWWALEHLKVKNTTNLKVENGNLKYLK